MPRLVYLLRRSAHAFVWRHFIARRPAIPTGTVTIIHRLPNEVVAASRGDVFDVTADVTLRWSCAGVKRRHLIDAARDHHADVRVRLARLIIELARQYGPHEANELEQRLTEELKERIFAYPWRDKTVHCEPRVQIVLDDEVREALRPVLLERMQLDCELQTGIRRADLVDQLTRHWSGILEKLQDDPLLRHSAQLTEEQFAEVVQDMEQVKQQGVAELQRLIRQAIDEHDNLGIGGLEWTTAWEQAIKMAAQQQGVSPGYAPAE